MYSDNRGSAFSKALFWILHNKVEGKVSRVFFHSYFIQCSCNAIYVDQKTEFYQLILLQNYQWYYINTSSSIYHITFEKVKKRKKNSINTFREWL